MPAEYRCDGACHRILSDIQYTVGYWNEVDRFYCADSDYPRLLAARTKFQNTVQGVVDKAYAQFLLELGNFITVPLVPAVVLITISDSALAKPKTDKTGTLVKPPKP